VTQQTYEDGSTPSAHGICQDGSTPQQACPGGVGRDTNGICFSPPPITAACPVNQIRDNRGNCISSPNAQPNIKNGSYVIDLGGGRFQLLTFSPISNTNTIVPVCPQDTQLYFNYFLNKDYI
jgi:hypothetical protein